MIYTAVFLRRAYVELLEAWIWYEEKQTNLGDRFKDEVYKRVRQIEENPYRYPEKKKHFRETMITVFPFKIIYRVNRKNKQIAIVSIFHVSRNPQRKYK